MASTNRDKARKAKARAQPASATNPIQQQNLVQQQFNTASTTFASGPVAQPSTMMRKPTSHIFGMPTPLGNLGLAVSQSFTTSSFMPTIIVGTASPLVSGTMPSAMDYQFDRHHFILPGSQDTMWNLHKKRDGSMRFGGQVPTNTLQRYLETTVGTVHIQFATKTHTAEQKSIENLSPSPLERSRNLTTRVLSRRYRVGIVTSRNLSRFQGPLSPQLPLYMAWRVTKVVLVPKLKTWMDSVYDVDVDIEMSGANAGNIITANQGPLLATHQVVFHDTDMVDSADTPSLLAAGTMFGASTVSKPSFFTPTPAMPMPNSTNPTTIGSMAPAPSPTQRGYQSAPSPMTAAQAFGASFMNPTVGASTTTTATTASIGPGIYSVQHQQQFLQAGSAQTQIPNSYTSPYLPTGNPGSSSGPSSTLVSSNATFAHPSTFIPRSKMMTESAKITSSGSVEMAVGKVAEDIGQGQVINNGSNSSPSLGSVMPASTPHPNKSYCSPYANQLSNPSPATTVEAIKSLTSSVDDQVISAKQYEQSTSTLIQMRESIHEMREAPVKAVPLPVFQETLKSGSDDFISFDQPESDDESESAVEPAYIVEPVSVLDTASSSPVSDIIVLEAPASQHSYYVSSQVLDEGEREKLREAERIIHRAKQDRIYIEALERTLERERKEHKAYVRSLPGQIAQEVRKADIKWNRELSTKKFRVQMLEADKDSWIASNVKLRDQEIQSKYTEKQLRNCITNMKEDHELEKHQWKISYRILSGEAAKDLTPQRSRTITRHNRSPLTAPLSTTPNAGAISACSPLPTPTQTAISVLSTASVVVASQVPVTAPHVAVTLLPAAPPLPAPIPPPKVELPPAAVLYLKPLLRKRKPAAIRYQRSQQDSFFINTCWAIIFAFFFFLMMWFFGIPGVNYFSVALDKFKTMVSVSMTICSEAACLPSRVSSFLTSYTSVGLETATMAARSEASDIASWSHLLLQSSSFPNLKTIFMEACSKVPDPSNWLPLPFASDLMGLKTLFVTGCSKVSELTGFVPSSITSLSSIDLKTAITMATSKVFNLTDWDSLPFTTPSAHGLKMATTVAYSTISCLAPWVSLSLAALDSHDFATIAGQTNLSAAPAQDALLCGLSRDSFLGNLTDVAANWNATQVTKPGREAQFWCEPMCNLTCVLDTVETDFIRFPNVVDEGPASHITGTPASTKPPLPHISASASPRFHPPSWLSYIKVSAIGVEQFLSRW